MSKQNDWYPLEHLTEEILKLRGRITELEAQKTLAYKEVEIQCRAVQKLKAKLDKVRGLKRYTNVGIMCLYGSSSRDVITGEKSPLFIRAAELEQALEKDS